MANKCYTTIRHEASAEFEEKRSLFIGYAVPLKSEEDAAEFIKKIKSKHKDATHNVFGYTMKNGIIARYSDDGEPQGTAGMPVLDVIRKSGVDDACVVVTRYFGGTLLGTGGLVRAYTSAALGALENAEIIRYDIYSTVKMSVSYSDYGKITAPLSDMGFRVEDTLYDTGVTLVGRIIKSKLEDLKAELTEATAGRIEFETLSEEFGY